MHTCMSNQISSVKHLILENIYNFRVKENWLQTKALVWSLARRTGTLSEPWCMCETQALKQFNKNM